MANARRDNLILQKRDLPAAMAGMPAHFAGQPRLSLGLVIPLLAIAAMMLSGCSPTNYLRDDYMGKSLLQPGKTRPGSGTTTDPALERAYRYSKGIPPAAANPKAPASAELPQQNTAPAASDNRIGFPTLGRPSGANRNSGPVLRDENGNPILN